MAAQDVGLSGTGRLHDLFVTIEGVTPGQFKQAGVGLTLTYGVFDSPFGAYVLGAINEKIALLHFLDSDQNLTPDQIAAAAWPEATLDHSPIGPPIDSQPDFSAGERAFQPVAEPPPAGVDAWVGVSVESVGGVTQNSGGAIGEL